LTLHNLGLARAELGQPEAARATLERALAIFERTLGPDSPEAAGTRSALLALD